MTCAAEAPAAQVRRLRWWRELIYVGAVYGVYSTIRNQFGSAGGTAGLANAHAYGHAKVVIEIERFFGLYQEQHIQHWYLGLPHQGFIAFWNVYYGTAHFIVTAAALIWLFRRDPGRYPTWRNTLAVTTLLALIGFSTFALMPPRLLDESQASYGPPATAAPHDYGFVDTLARYHTLWSFDSGALKDISNQYAAMPSLHIGWSLWSAFVLVPMVRRRWVKGLVILYPAVTFFCIVATANHYWLDGAGGVAIFTGGWLIGSRVAALFDHRREWAGAGNRPR